MFTILIIQLLMLKKKEAFTKQQITCPKTVHSPAHLRTPKKVEVVSESKTIKLGLKKALQQGSQQEDMFSTHRQELLILQIKQLRRENNFLKKKLTEISGDFGFEKGRGKQNKQKQQLPSSSNLQIMPLSINIFFEEVQSLLSTIVNLFRIEFTEQEQKVHHQKFTDEINEVCPIRKHTLLKKYYLKRKLQSILLQNQQKKYPMFIDLFTQYFTFKEESQEKILATIDRMTTRAQQLNEIILKKEHQRKKSRGTVSSIKKEYELPFQNLGIPTTKNFIQLNKASAISPTSSQKPKKASKFGLSPSQKGMKNQ